MKLYATLVTWGMTAVIGAEVAKKGDPLALVIWVVFVGLSVRVHEEMR